MHYIVMEITFVDHEKPWKNHGIVFFNFCGNPDEQTRPSLSCSLMRSVPILLYWPKICSFLASL